MGLMGVTGSIVFPVVALGGGGTNGTHGVKVVGWTKLCVTARDGRGPVLVA